MARSTTLNSPDGAGLAAAVPSPRMRAFLTAAFALACAGGAAAQQAPTAAEVFARIGTPTPVTATAPALAPARAQPAWQRFAVPAPASGGLPRIAIVIDDVGVHIPNSWRAVELPGPLTISLMTYALNLSALAQAAHGAGHELLLHVPMEPEGPDVDPGPNVLLAQTSREELLRRITWALGRVDGVVGVNNHMGSRFTADRAAMDLLMGELSRRGLLFLDSLTTGQSVGRSASRAAGVPYLARDVFLDNEPDVAVVRAQLAELESVARKDGAAIAIAHPKPGTLQALQEWLPTLADRGLVLVPLTALLPAAPAVAARAP